MYDRSYDFGGADLSFGAAIPPRGVEVPPLSFDRELIADERYEAACVVDVDNDGVLDIVSGAYWYPGPRFDKKCFRGSIAPDGEDYDDYFEIPMDVDGDGYVDVLSGGWAGETLRWHRNPGGARDRTWEVHDVAHVGPIETARAWDIDSDGIPEVLPNTPAGGQFVFKLDHDAGGRPRGTFTKHLIWQSADQAAEKGAGHGLGCGDITGNGRADIVLNRGWLEAPLDPWGGEWKLHADFDLGRASVPILVVDVNGDGLNDLIVGNAHGYGLDWYEQRVRAGGAREWVKHPIDPYSSQYHDMAWVDLDGDGKPELITGKRYRAHSGHDPGEYDPLGVYYFKWTGESFVKEVVDFGRIGEGSGCGICFAVADLDDNGLPEIIAPGKDGLYIFWNRGFAENKGDM